MSSKALNTRLNQVTKRTRQSSPGEFCPSFLLLRIDIARGCCEDTFQLLQPREKLFGLLFDIFVLLEDRQRWMGAVWVT